MIMAFKPVAGLFAAIILLGQHVGSALAVCEGVEENCGNIRNPINQPGGIDPNDEAYLGLVGYYCACNAGGQATMTVTYTGKNGAATTETASTVLGTQYSEGLVTFSYTGIERNIASGSQVTFVQRKEGADYRALSFQYTPVTSIYYTDTTTTVTNTIVEPSVTGTVTTTTAVEYLTQDTSVSDCTTGTAYVTATRTSVVTSTITPKPKTVYVEKVHRTTKNAKCCADAGKAPHQRRDAGDNGLVLAKRVNGGLVETPWFSYYQGSPERTTYTTSAFVEQTSTTSTFVVTTTDTVTDTSTVSPDPLTTTICNDVEATSTTTVTRRRTTTKRLPRSTKTVTHHHYVTITKYPHYPPPICPTPRPAAPKSPAKGKLSLPKSSKKKNGN